MCADPWTVKMSDEKEKSSGLQQRRRNATAFENNSRPDESKTFLKDIKMTIFLMKLAGLLPMYKKLSNCELGPPNKITLVYLGIIHASVYAATIFIVYHTLKDGYDQTLFSYSPPSNISYWAEVLFWVLTYVFTIFNCSRYLKPSVQILNDIIKVDKEINARCSVTIASECGFAPVYFILTLACLVYIIVIKVMAGIKPMTLTVCLTFIIYSLNSVFPFIIIIYISVLFRILNGRLAYLNSVINRYNYRYQQDTTGQDVQRLSIIQTQEGIQQHRPLMENFPDDTMFVFNVYHKIMYIYNTMNDCYSFIIFLYMGYGFYSATTASYNLFVNITTRAGITRNAMLLCFAFVILQTSVMTMFTRCCGQATNQANETAQLMAKVYGSKSQHKNIINKYLTKNVRHKVSFPICGFYTINDTTMFKLFIAASIYLIILIQFKQLEESKKVELETTMAN